MPMTPMLFVDDVEASSRWYQGFLGLKSAHGGPEFEMLAEADGSMPLFLHRAGAEEHGEGRLVTGAPRGSGVLFYVSTPDVRAAFYRAQELGVQTEGPPHFVENARHTEFVARDPDGYALAVFQPGEA